MCTYPVASDNGKLLVQTCTCKLSMCLWWGLKLEVTKINPFYIWMLFAFIHLRGKCTHARQKMSHWISLYMNNTLKDVCNLKRANISNIINAGSIPSENNSVFLVNLETCAAITFLGQKNASVLCNLYSFFDNFGSSVRTLLWCFVFWSKWACYYSKLLCSFVFFCIKDKETSLSLHCLGYSIFLIWISLKKV